jgi:hypothetical protein
MVHVIQVCRQLAVPSWSCCSKSVYKPVWHIPLLSVQWITRGDGQRNCPKHVEFNFQNKFEKLVHLVGFIIRKLVHLVGFIIRKFNTSVWFLKLIFRSFVSWRQRTSLVVTSRSTVKFCNDELGLCRIVDCVGVILYIIFLTLWR